MNCNEVQYKLSGAEPGRDAPDVRAHLEGCAECRAADRRERRLDRLLDVARAERPDAHFEDRLIARLRSDMADHKPPALFWTPARIWGAGLAAAAAVLLFAWPQTLFTPQTDVPQMAGGDLKVVRDSNPSSPAGETSLLASDQLLAAPAARSMFASAPEHPAAASMMPGLSLHEIPGAQSTLVLASTNTPLRLSPGNIQYGGESMMVDFTPQN